MHEKKTGDENKEDNEGKRGKRKIDVFLFFFPLSSSRDIEPIIYLQPFGLLASIRLAYLFSVDLPAPPYPRKETLYLKLARFARLFDYLSNGCAALYKCAHQKEILLATSCS